MMTTEAKTNPKTGWKKILAGFLPGIFLIGFNIGTGSVTAGKQTRSLRMGKSFVIPYHTESLEFFSNTGMEVLVVYPPTVP